MRFNENTGFTEQEFALVKKEINKTVDAIEQIEEELAVKKGHWYKFGEYEENVDTIDFGHKVSNVAIIAEEVTSLVVSAIIGGEESTDILINMANDDVGFINSDGRYYVVEGDSDQSKEATKDIIANGGIDGIRCHIVGGHISVYVID